MTYAQMVTLPQERRYELGLLMVVLSVLELHNNKIEQGT